MLSMMVNVSSTIKLLVLISTVYMVTAKTPDHRVYVKISGSVLNATHVKHMVLIAISHSNHVIVSSVIHMGIVQSLLQQPVYVNQTFKDPCAPNAQTIISWNHASLLVNVELNIVFHMENV